MTPIKHPRIDTLDLRRRPRDLSPMQHCNRAIAVAARPVMATGKAAR